MAVGVLSIKIRTRSAPWTRSIAPPIPFTMAPGTIQSAKLPDDETCMCRAPQLNVPAALRSQAPNQRMPRPAGAATVSLPALIRLGIDCVIVWIGAGSQDAVLGVQGDFHERYKCWQERRFGRPIPRLTYCCRSSRSPRVLPSRSTSPDGSLLAWSFSPPVATWLLLDLGVLRAGMHNPLDEHAVGAQPHRTDLTRLTKFLDLSDGRPSRHRCKRYLNLSQSFRTRDPLAYRHIWRVPVQNPRLSPA